MSHNKNLFASDYWKSFTPKIAKYFHKTHAGFQQKVNSLYMRNCPCGKNPFSTYIPWGDMDAFQPWIATARRPDSMACRISFARL
jgi:hypothetical protein